jgi:hypothetical protein
MNFSTKETLIGLQCLGLDLETGKSTEILVKELEDLTGIRQVSNGSRIIRRDCATFSKFKYQISYGVNGEVISYIFNGYKDSSDLITEHSQDILRLKDKIKCLYENIEDLEFAMLDILIQDEFKFSKEDLGL